MNRSKKYLEYCRSIADSLLFLKNSKEEQKNLLNYLEEFKILIQSNESVFKKFPALVRELQGTLNIREFNTETAEKKTEDLKNFMVKLSYISEMLGDIQQIKNPALETKLTLDNYKHKFIADAEKLVARSIDTLHFELQKFEALYRKTAEQLNTEKQKRDKVRSLLGQDLPLISQFPLVKKELESIADGESKGIIGADYILTNYISIKENIKKLNEFSMYFLRLSKDYLQILAGTDLEIFQNIKNQLTLGNLSAEFVRLNSNATICKNKMISLDTLRNQMNSLRTEINAKINDLSPNHQSYVRTEIAIIQELLLDKPGIDFEKAGSKINTVRAVLKKEFVSNDQRATDALYIRQSIARYENNIWQEDLTVLFEELNNYASGNPGWSKEDFGQAIQKFITHKNEALETVKIAFELFFEKNRDYKNRFEKIANTKAANAELESLVKEMGSFKPLKNIFYKFIK